MTPHSNAQLEGSVLTPNGWVEGKVNVGGGVIMGVEGKALAAGAKPEGSFHPAGLHRSSRPWRRRCRLAGRRRRRSQLRALPHVARHDGHRADHRDRARRSDQRSLSAIASVTASDSPAKRQC